MTASARTWAGPAPHAHPNPNPNPNPNPMSDPNANPNANPNPNPNPNPSPSPSPNPNPNPNPNQVLLRREHRTHLLHLHRQWRLLRRPLPPTSPLHLPNISPTSPYISPTSPLHLPNISPTYRLHLPYISPTSPLHLPYISPTSPLHLAYISPTSPLHLPGELRIALTAYGLDVSDDKSRSYLNKYDRDKSGSMVCHLVITPARWGSTTTR